MQFRRLRWVSTVLVCLIASAGVFAGSAGAADVGCGSEITANTTLVHNLTCSGDGLLVDNGVTLNLGGHTIQGSGTGTGITVDGPGFGTVVTNGTIRGFSVGMFPDAATVSHMRISVNSSGGVFYFGGCNSLS